MTEDPTRFAPMFSGINLSPEEEEFVAPFVTNTDASVYVPMIPAPELVGALCSRTSRAAGDLREVFAKEFLVPFLQPQDHVGGKGVSADASEFFAKGLYEYIEVVRRFGFETIFSHPKARAFYDRWLAQYGDDSIAQMGGTHLVYWGISQVALKHFEDQRIGLAPIEKSTRYVDYSSKVSGQYRYYTDPTLKDVGLMQQYRAAMDGLFVTYVQLVPKMQAWLHAKHPEVEENACRAKALDVLRGLLPCSTLSQVAFFGNGQAFEYLVTRSAKHPLGEIRWASLRAQEELAKIVPAFLRRLDSEPSQRYQTHLQERVQRMVALSTESFDDERITAIPSVSVSLVEWDPDAERKIAAALLYDAPGNHRSWKEVIAKFSERPELVARTLDEHFRGRTERWQKVGRALENAYVRFEIVMDIGAYRDLHRHRMLTQQRQLFSCHHGYDTPNDIVEAGFEKPYREAIEMAQAVFAALEAHDVQLAQYAVPMAQYVRFQQYQNLRAFFWEVELRTIPEGHPNYRAIEQEKYRLLYERYPALLRYAQVNLEQYDFSRRGQTGRIAAKERELERLRKLDDVSKKDN